MMPELAPLFDHPLLKPMVTDEIADLSKRADAVFAQVPVTMREFRDYAPVTKSEWLEFGRQGFLGLTVPRELGGQGLGSLAPFVLSHSLAKTLDVGLSLGMHVHNDVAMGWLVATQQSEIRDRFLPEMLTGRLIGCTCFTERGDVPMTTAQRTDGKLILNGQKAYAINGVIADLCFLTADLDGQLCTVLVEKDTPGVSITKERDKLGARSVDQADIAFENAVVPEQNIVSKPGLQQLFHWNNVMTTARAHVAFDGYMMMKALFEYMLTYSRTRLVGGKPLGEWSIHQQVLANAYTNLEIIKAGIVNFIDARSRNERANLVEEMATLKNFAIERAYEFALACCDMEGGKGFMNDSVTLQILKQLMALRYSTGSQYKTNEIASAFHRENHKRLAAV